MGSGSKKPWDSRDVFAIFIVGLILGIVIGLWIPQLYLF